MTQSPTAITPLSGFASDILATFEASGMTGRTSVSAPRMGLDYTTIMLPVLVAKCKLFPKGLGVLSNRNLPASVITILECWREHPGVIVVPDECAGLKWARNAVGYDWNQRGETNRLLGVFTLEELELWLPMKVEIGKPVTKPERFTAVGAAWQQRGLAL